MVEYRGARLRVSLEPADEHEGRGIGGSVIVEYGSQSEAGPAVLEPDSRTNPQPGNT